MNKKASPNYSRGIDDSIVNNFIIILFSVLSLFIESIIIITSFFKKGILKKEVLSKKTNLGFDLIIKRK